MSKFDAAIIHLKIYAGIKPVREGEKFSVGYGGIPPAPVRQQDIHAAIRVLEAAGKLTEKDKSWLLSKVDWAIAEYVPAIEGMVCPGAAMKDRFRSLLAALPDKEKP